MKKLAVVAVLVGFCFDLVKSGYIQHHMQYEWREMVERDRADIKAQCEAINCWHL